MSVFGKVQKSFIAGLIRKLFRVTIINPENEPGYSEFTKNTKNTKNNTDTIDIKSYIACINHSSNWDPILIGACMHRPLRYMAKSELFKIPILKSIVKLFGAYPVNRESAGISSIKTTIDILRKGEVVGMYPQGHRAKKIHPNTITPKNGVAMAAIKAKSGILPITVITKGYKVRVFRKTILVFGKYIPFEELEKFKDGENIKETAGENINIYKKITKYVYGEILENYSKYDNLNEIGKN